jgi:L-methionine (R)-S-oxide reductase
MGAEPSNRRRPIREVTMNAKKKQLLYDRALKRIRDLTKGQADLIAVMATVACELHSQFDHFHWTGFYRVVEPGLLKIGPYQGAHACLQIAFDRGVCGAAARSRKTQLVSDLREFGGYIACSPSTRSEIVVPVMDSAGNLMAVLDIDSDQTGSFDQVDKINLERLCMMIGSIDPQSA